MREKVATAGAFVKVNVRLLTRDQERMGVWQDALMTLACTIGAVQRLFVIVFGGHFQQTHSPLNLLARLYRYPPDDGVARGGNSQFHLHRLHQQYGLAAFHPVSLANQDLQNGAGMGARTSPVDSAPGELPRRRTSSL